MAEHGAHLTSGGVSDIKRPNIFEVLACENLSSMIRPALRHLIRVFSEKFPEQLGRVVQHFDELFLVLDTFVQSYYLKQYGGSFAENFYDLKRVSVNNPDQPVTSKNRRISLACLVLIPYLRHKLDTLFEAIQYKEGSGNGSSFLQKNVPFKQRLARLYLFIYPYIHSLWELLNLSYMLSYMLRKGRWHSPSMHLSGSQLSRLDPNDKLATSQSFQGSLWSDLSAASKLLFLTKMVASAAGVCLSTGLSVGVFFLQFLDWWYNSDSSARSLTALPVPQPPKQQNLLKDVSPANCPLCLRFRTNSTALAVSGYVFCYSCIADHVRKDKSCPLTGYPASMDHLIRIYEHDL